MKIERPIIIVEGIDNVGKGTLIQNLIKRIGFAHVIKYDKPKLTDQHLNLREYQVDSFLSGFGLIAAAVSMHEVPQLIFDRFHLGELVYSPLYRGYDGHYVFQQEASVITQVPDILEKTLLVLLTAKNFEVLADDGKSFDRSAVEKEQGLFIDAFNLSWLRKIRVDVNNEDGTWRSPDEIADLIHSVLKKGAA